MWLMCGAGDPCGTCSLLREYFARDDWDGVLADAVAGNDGEGGDADSGVGVNAAFVMQLRDMLARMDELGVSEDREGTALSALRHWSPRVERLHVQWRLAFALRREYETAVSRMYRASTGWTRLVCWSRGPRRSGWSAMTICRVCWSSTTVRTSPSPGSRS